MIGDFERPGRRRAAQDRALRRYLRTQIEPYSSRYADALRRKTVSGVADLAEVPLTVLDRERDPSPLVLQPTADRIAASPDRRLRRRLWWARVTRRVAAFNRNEIEPRYKPIHWHVARSGDNVVPVGYTATDLERLAGIGREMLEMAGVRPLDVIVSLQPPVASPAFWQVALGARAAGVSTLFLADGEPQRIAQLRPNVLAGRAGDLVRLLDDGRSSGLSFAGLHTLLVTGEPLDPVLRRRLAELGGSPTDPAAVVSAWAPPGVRSLWSECRTGTDVHTWPAAEVLEMVDPLSGAAVPFGTEGEIVYTPLGWSGTVMLRLRTGVFGCLDESACVSCGRTSPRIRLVPFLPPFARILDEHPDVDLWQAELRVVDGAEELIVFITPRRGGHPGSLLRELDRQLSVTQFVVLGRRALSERLRTHDDARVVDMRE